MKISLLTMHFFLFSYWNYKKFIPTASSTLPQDSIIQDLNKDKEQMDNCLCMCVSYDFSPIILGNTAIQYCPFISQPHLYIKEVIFLLHWKSFIITFSLDGWANISWISSHRENLWDGWLKQENLCRGGYWVTLIDRKVSLGEERLPTSPCATDYS